MHSSSTCRKFPGAIRQLGIIQQGFRTPVDKDQSGFIE